MVKKEIDEIQEDAWIGILRSNMGVRITGDYCAVTQGKAHIKALLEEDNMLWQDAFIVKVAWGARNVTGWLKVK